MEVDFYKIGDSDLFLTVQAGEVDDELPYGYRRKVEKTDPDRSQKVISGEPPDWVDSDRIIGEIKNTAITNLNPELRLRNSNREGAGLCVRE